MKALFSILTVTLLMTAALVTLARRNSSGTWMVYSWRVYALEKAEIHLMSGDGRWERNLTPGPECGESPHWSPDGVWISFTSDCEETAGNMLRLRPIGSTPEIVSNEVSFSLDSQWSPDGKRLLVTRANPDLFIVDVDGGTRQLASDYRDAQWSPDGEWIYARPIRNERSSLDRIHVETGQVETLLPAQPKVTDMSWSSDARQMALIIRGDSGDKLVLSTADGSTLTAVPTDLPEPQFESPRWSPDDEWIAFLEGKPLSGQHIYRVRPDGRDLQWLTDGNPLPSVQYLQWSPDGQWLLFEVNEGHRDATIVRLRADGSSMQNLTPGSAFYASPEYAPVFGLDWHPRWLLIAALGLFAASLLARRLTNFLHFA